MRSKKNKVSHTTNEWRQFDAYIEECVGFCRHQEQKQDLLYDFGDWNHRGEKNAWGYTEVEEWDVGWPYWEESWGICMTDPYPKLTKAYRAGLHTFLSYDSIEQIKHEAFRKIEAGYGKCQ